MASAIRSTLLYTVHAVVESEVIDDYLSLKTTCNIVKCSRVHAGWQRCPQLCPCLRANDSYGVSAQTKSQRFRVSTKSYLLYPGSCTNRQKVVILKPIHSGKNVLIRSALASYQSEHIPNYLLVSYKNKHH